MAMPKLRAGGFPIGQSALRSLSTFFEKSGRPKHPLQRTLPNIPRTEMTGSVALDSHSQLVDRINGGAMDVDAQSNAALSVADSTATSRLCVTKRPSPPPLCARLLTLTQSCRCQQTPSLQLRPGKPARQRPQPCAC